MCLIQGVLETPLVTRNWYWVQYSCGTHLKVRSDDQSFKTLGGNYFPCPVHDSQNWKQPTSVDKFGDRNSVDIVIGD